MTTEIYKGVEIETLSPGEHGHRGGKGFVVRCFLPNLKTKEPEEHGLLSMDGPGCIIPHIKKAIDDHINPPETYRRIGNLSDEEKSELGPILDRLSKLRDYVTEEAVEHWELKKKENAIIESAVKRLGGPKERHIYRQGGTLFADMTRTKLKQPR